MAQLTLGIGLYVTDFEAWASIKSPPISLQHMSRVIGVDGGLAECNFQLKSSTIIITTQQCHNENVMVTKITLSLILTYFDIRFPLCGAKSTLYVF